MAIISPVSLRPLPPRARPRLVAGGTATVPPVDLEGLSASAYGALARSKRESGDGQAADRLTLEAVKAAKDGFEALRYATQRYGPQADAPHPMNQYVRSDAPYVASPAMQAQAVELAAARFTSHYAAVSALRSYPARTPEANTIMLKRIADLAVDRDQVTDIRSLVRLLGTPEAVAYVEAVRQAKPRTSFWTRMDRILRQL